MLIIFMVDDVPLVFCERYRDIVPTDAEVEAIENFYDGDVDADLTLVVHDKNTVLSQAFLDDLFRKRGIAIIDDMEPPKHRLTVTPEVAVDPNRTSAQDLWDLLDLIGHPVDIEKIREWPDDFRTSILIWASAVHLAASSTPIVVPPKPVSPKEGFKGDLNTGVTQSIEPEPCPYCDEVSLCNRCASNAEVKRDFGG